MENIPYPLKYSIVDGKAYTEESILIRNLVFCVQGSNYPKVLNYFEKFGTFEIKLETSGDECRGTVEFADSRAAASVLQTEGLDTDTLADIKIRPNYSWEQPNCKDVLLVLQNICATDNQQEHTNSSILYLNDECLTHIYNRLPLKYHVNFALTCKRLFQLFHSIAPPKCKYLNYFNFKRLPISQQINFLINAGEYVEKLDIRVPTTLEAKLISTFCVNVKELHLTGVKYPIFEILVANMKKLTKLVLDRVNFSSRMFLNLGEICPNLKYLSMNMQSSLHVSCMPNLQQLEELEILNCIFSGGYSYVDVFGPVKNLSRLSIITYNLFTAEQCKKISETLLQLESLKLEARFEDFSSLAMLPKIKKIEICSRDNFNPTFRDMFINNLCVYNGQQLEELILNCSNSINYHAACMLTELKKLKVLICPRSDELNDSCLKKFIELPELEALNVNGCNITNEGLIHLVTHCPQLKLLQ